MYRNLKKTVAHGYRQLSINTSKEDEEEII